MKIKNVKAIAFLQNLEKAYTEGVYADTPANRKLGRVGMSYAQYNNTIIKEDNKENKYNTKKEKLLKIFKERLKLEEENYIKAGKPEYNKLSKTTLFASLKNEGIIYRKINALKLAIEILEKPFNEINLRESVRFIIPDSNLKKIDLEDKANSIFLNEKKEVAKELLSYLPIQKNEILNYI